MTTRHGFEWTTLRFLSFRVPKRKPSVQKQKDARKSSEIQRLSTDAEEQKRLVAEENLQKKSAEERTKKAASTQSRQLSDLVNYAGKGNNYELKSTGCIKKNVQQSINFRGAQVQWLFRWSAILADVFILRNKSFAALFGRGED